MIFMSTQSPLARTGNMFCQEDAVNPIIAVIAHKAQNACGRLTLARKLPVWPMMAELIQSRSVRMGNLWYQGHVTIWTTRDIARQAQHACGRLQPEKKSLA